mgnify:CR=1 FL=1
MDRDLDEMEARLDAAQAAQYKAVGVTMEGWDYYYKGKLVNIFLDLHRPDNSIITLNMNPEGTVNIKIVRNEKGAITGVAELTQEEIEDLFGEDDGQDWDWDNEKWNWDWDWDDELALVIVVPALHRDPGGLILRGLRGVQPGFQLVQVELGLGLGR